MSVGLWGEKVLPAAWYRPLTLGDIAIVERMDETTREVVERYARNYPSLIPRADDDAYDEGFRDGVDEASEAAAGVTNWRKRERRRRA